MKFDNQLKHIFLADKVIWTMLLLFTPNIILVTWPVAEGQTATIMQELNCDLFNEGFMTCEPYVTTNLTTLPSLECCQEVTTLDQLFRNDILTTDQRVTICMCIQMAQQMEGLSDDLDPNLAERCGLNTYSVPRILSTTDCSTF